MVRKAEKKSMTVTCAEIKPECGTKPLKPLGSLWNAMKVDQQKAFMKRMASWKICDRKMDAWKQLCAKSVPADTKLAPKPETRPAEKKRPNPWEE